MADHPEILVHVGAPSTVSDDARYRALVGASLAFIPLSHRSIFRIYENTDGTGFGVNVDETRSSSSLGQSSSFLQEGDKTISFRSNDELYESENNLEKHAQNTKSARSPPKDVVQSASSFSYHEGLTEDSGLPLQALIPYDGRSSAQFQSTSSHQSESKSVSHEQVEVRGSPLIETRETRDESGIWEAPLEVIPDSQDNEDIADQTNLDPSVVQVYRSFVPDTILQSRRFSITGDNGTEDSQESEITRILSSIPSSSPVESSFAHRLDVKTNAESHNLLNEAPPNSLESASVLGKRKTSANTSSAESKLLDPKLHPWPLKNHAQVTKRPTLPQTGEIISLDVLPIEIRAPDPPVSNDKFQTHITPTLQSLAERMKRSSRFTPTRQIRELHPLERGYWFIPCITITPDNDIPTTTHDPEDTTRPEVDTTPSQQTWTLSFFSQFWCFLRDFLTEGRAGWGIWCLLEPSSTSPSPTPSPSQSKQNRPTTTKVNLKLYTWGEVAPHMYLLLFLATERRIKKMAGVEWRDARNEGIIVM